MDPISVDQRPFFIIIASESTEFFRLAQCLLTSFAENNIQRVRTILIDDRAAVRSKVFTMILFNA